MGYVTHENGAGIVQYLSELTDLLDLTYSSEPSDEFDMQGQGFFQSRIHPVYACSLHHEAHGLPAER